MKTKSPLIYTKITNDKLKNNVVNQNTVKYLIYDYKLRKIMVSKIFLIAYIQSKTLNIDTRYRCEEQAVFFTKNSYFFVESFFTKLPATFCTYKMFCVKCFTKCCHASLQKRGLVDLVAGS